MQLQIPVEYLVQQLNQIPGITVAIQYETSEMTSELYLGMSFAQYARYWLTHYKLGTVKGNTYQGTYEEPLYLHIIPYFRDLQIQAVTPADVRAFFDVKRSEGYALETMRKMRACLKAIFSTAQENKLCYNNPVTSSLVLRSDKPPKEKNCWTREQVDIANNFADAHPKGLGIQILLETGISRSELLGLQWPHHFPNSRVLAITDGLVYQKDPFFGVYGLVCEGLKNGYRLRALPISARLNARLALEPQTIFRHGQPIKTQHIIHAPRGGPFSPSNWYDREYKPFMRDLTEEHPEIPWLTPHELRHTVATVTANENVNLHFVAQLLGHCNLDMLGKRYLHRDIEPLRRALGR